MAPEMMIVKDNQNVSRWNPETGYDLKFSDNDYPIRVFNARQDAVLTVETRILKQDLEYLCRYPLQGFKVILSTPGDTFKLSQDFLHVPIGEQANILISPRYISTNKGLRGYEPNQRRCFFNDERKLRFFRSYSQNTCATECLANFTMIECGCVKFSMPSKPFLLSFH